MSTAMSGRSSCPRLRVRVGGDHEWLELRPVLGGCHDRDGDGVMHGGWRPLLGIGMELGDAVVDPGFEVLAGCAGGGVGAGVFVVAESDGDAVGGACDALTPRACSRGPGR